MSPQLARWSGNGAINKLLKMIIRVNVWWDGRGSAAARLPSSIWSWSYHFHSEVIILRQLLCRGRRPCSNHCITPARDNHLRVSDGPSPSYLAILIRESVRWNQEMFLSLGSLCGDWWSGEREKRWPRTQCFCSSCCSHNLCLTLPDCHHTWPEAWVQLHEWLRHSTTIICLPFFHWPATMSHILNVHNLKLDH